MKTLDEVRAHVAALAAPLDPQSRYVTELLAIVNAAQSVEDLFRRLDAGCRGKHWAGEDAFTAMSRLDKLRCNLVTNETQLMRFDAPELAFLRGTVLPAIGGADRETKVLSLPCSHGEEAVSLASELLSGGWSRFKVQGLDVQAACIEQARTGVLPYPGLPAGVRCVVDRPLRKHLRYRVADVFADDLGGPYDLIVCRNFLGYFVPDSVRMALRRLCAALRPDYSFLMVDDFILSKHPECFDGLPLRRIDGVPAFCAFTA